MHTRIHLFKATLRLTGMDSILRPNPNLSLQLHGASVPNGSSLTTIGKTHSAGAGKIIKYIFTNANFQDAELRARSYCPGTARQPSVQRSMPNNKIGLGQESLGAATASVAAAVLLYFWSGGAFSAGSACAGDDDDGGGGGGGGEARFPNCQCKNCCWCTKSLKLTCAIS